MFNDTLNSQETLDITDLKETGDDLKRAIYAAVKDTQAVLVQTLPNTLVMTARQFTDQADEMMAAYKSKDRIYFTPMNAMDVVVKDPYNLPSNQE